MVLSSKLLLCQQLFTLLLNLHPQKCIFKNIIYQLFRDHHHILSVLQTHEAKSQENSQTKTWKCQCSWLLLSNFLMPTHHSHTLTTTSALQSLFCIPSPLKHSCTGPCIMSLAEDLIGHLHPHLPMNAGPLLTVFLQVRPTCSPQSPHMTDQKAYFWASPKTY